MDDADASLRMLRTYDSNSTTYVQSVLFCSGEKEKHRNKEVDGETGETPSQKEDS